MPPEEKRERVIPAASAVLDSGEIVEMVFRPETRETRFVVWNGETWREESSIERSGSERLVPFSAGNNLLRHEVVLLPSAPEEYGSESDLLSSIRGFIHRYVQVSPRFEEVSARYLLLSWLYDSFHELPYLRIRAEYGSGKTRYLQTVGSLAYRPIFASGASTISPIFRILDSFGGTLVMDEGDFRASDEKSEVTKILNNGNVKGFPVLRAEQVGNRKEFDPRAYSVFGPKIVATRGFFEDKALESRFLTEEMGTTTLRPDIPISMPPAYKGEALHLRNQLLLFRFRNLGRVRALAEVPDLALEPRLRQVFAPLFAVTTEPEARRDLLDLARGYQKEVLCDRGMEMEAQVLEAIRDLAASQGYPVSVGEVAALFADRHQDDFDRKVTPKWIGHVIRKKLRLHAERRHGSYVLPESEKATLSRLLERYGLAAPS